MFGYEGRGVDKGIEVLTSRPEVQEGLERQEREDMFKELPR